MDFWTAFLLCGAMVSVVAWIVALLRENGVCPLDAAARFVRGLPWGGRLAVLPLFAALVVYGSVKNHSNEIGSESGFSRVDRVERVDGGETGFNAEKAEAQEAQRGEGGVGGDPAMLNSANCSNLSSHLSHASHTSQGCEAHQILTTPNLPISNSLLYTHYSSTSSSLFWHAETPSNTLILT